MGSAEWPVNACQMPINTADVQLCDRYTRHVKFVATPERTPLIVAFDLDDTLAPSKSPLMPPMIEALRALLNVTQVCIISGGQFEQFDRQVLDELEGTPARSLHRLHLMPTCGTQYYRFDSGHGDQGHWVQRYSESLSVEAKQRALEAAETEARRLGLWESDTWGPILEDRETQITFSALGQQAPVDEKQRWDPDGSKKLRLRDAIAQRLPDLEVRAGGSTSVDITRRGIDKAYGMRKLAAETSIAFDDMLFVGDRLDEHGNDRPVLELGIACHAVTAWEDTRAYIGDVLLPMLRKPAESASSR